MKIHPKFIAGLEAQFGKEKTDLLLSSTVTSQDGKVLIQPPDSDHSQVVGELLALIYPGQEEQLTAGLPMEVAASAAVVLFYKGHVVLGVKAEKYNRGKYVLPAAGWFRPDDLVPIKTAQRVLHEKTGLSIHKSNLIPLRTFCGIRVGDDRKENFPTVQLGFYYELSASEWRTVCAQVEEGKADTAQLALYDAVSFEDLRQRDLMAFKDQEFFIRHFFKGLEESA
jgi:hypothetical protein